MSIRNGRPQPPTVQELQALERNIWKQMVLDLDSGRPSEALSALNRMVMDKIEKQPYADCGAFDQWDQLMWLMDDLADEVEEGVPTAIRNQANRVRYHKEGNCLGEMRTLALSLNGQQERRQKLDERVRCYVEELDELRRSLHHWLYRAPCSLPDDIHVGRYDKTVLRFESLISILAGGIRAHFFGEWLCSSLERTFLAELEEKPLEFPQEDF